MLRKQLPSAPKQGRLAPVSARQTPNATVLLTGFTPVGGASINVSWQVAQSLDGIEIDGHTIVAAQLPTEFDKSLEYLTDLIDAAPPGRWWSASARPADAVRSRSSALPSMSPTPALPTTPAPSRSTSRWSAAARRPISPACRSRPCCSALQQAGIAGEVSQTAGTFVCNHVFYGLMHTLERRRALQGVRGGFIHLPLPARAGQHRTWRWPTCQRGLRIAIACALATQQDVKLGAGTEH